MLVEGDLWAPNLLFHPDAEDATIAGPDVAAFLDWQSCHKGSVADDLARLIWSSTEPALRRGATDDFLAFYFDRLQEELHPQVPRPTLSGTKEGEVIGRRCPLTWRRCGRPTTT